jgi:RimJ/RimL family protein N-acetyltransferase
MTPSFRLETKRLTLRPVTPADRADLIALEADPQVMRFLNGGQPVPEAGLPDADFLTPRGTEPEVLAALDRATGRFIGWFGVFDDGLIDGLRTAEIGYRLARAGWGQGFATEGAVALIAVALDTWGFDRVRASTMAVNIGSRRVMEKAGMRHVETLFPAFSHPIVGADQGEVIYEIRASRGNP